MSQTALAKIMEEYQEVYFKGAYLSFKKEQLDVLFSGRFYRFQTHQEMIAENDDSPLLRWLNIDEADSADLVVTHHYDRHMKPDAFALIVAQTGEVTITTNNLRGFRYALEAFVRLVIKEDGAIICPVVTIAHSPSFQIRGVIEGFYGEPWTKEERLDCLRFMAANRLNTYMYAPKDDDYQRKLWREPYPETYLEHFRELLATAEQADIDFWYMISPGNDIAFTEQADMQVLEAKLEQLVNLGVRRFGLLMDDIDYILTGKNRVRFGHSAFAHAYLAQRVDDYLQRVLDDYTLAVCPTEYDNSTDSEYLTLLTQKLPQHIALFWTGPATLAGQITTEELMVMSESYGRQLIIWDNIPVNDYLDDKQRLFLSPYANRTPRMADEAFNVLGVVSNPMIQWELSKLTIADMSRYLWDCTAYRPESSWQHVLSEYTQSTEQADALRIFCWHNQNKYTHGSVPHTVQQKLSQQDIPALSGYLAELLQAVKCLEKLPNPEFQKKAAPWFERVKQDDKLWQAILADDVPMMTQLQKELSKASCRIGTDIPMTFLAQKRGE